MKNWAQTIVFCHLHARAHVQNGKGRRQGVPAKNEREEVMHRMKSFFAGLHTRVQREEGQALVEYALILGLVSVVAIAVLGVVGGDITDILGRVTAALSSAL
jgi:Flp pilus assembly pilin Flp